MRDAALDANEVLSGLGLADYEIIVVDDGSSDRTPEILTRTSDDIPRLRVEIHPRNLGYGAAILTGMRAAKMEYLAYTDSDLQFDLSDLARMLELLEEYDIAVGYRIKRDDRPHRLLISKAYNALCRELFRLRLRDIDCSLKILRSEVMEGMEMCTSGFGFDLELLVRSIRSHYRVVEIPVGHARRKGGESTVSAKEMFRTAVELHRVLRLL